MKTHKINHKEFPYGKVTKNLKNCVAYLNINRRRLSKEHHLPEFDYPDYWADLGLPSKISLKLSGDEVDWLQSELGRWENYCNLSERMVGVIV